MNTIGFPISHKENERRRAIIPPHVLQVKHTECLYVEQGYGDVLNYTDDDYRQAGIHVCPREEVLKKNVICDPKIGDADYLDSLHDQVIFGWIHAVQNRDITDKIINNRLTGIAWEDMYEMGRHTFWKNNEIAGEAALCHAYLLHGVFPNQTKVAVLGRGNTARGAIRTLNYMGAEVVVYDRKMEQLFRKEIGRYDVVINAILWDTSRKDHIVYREDLKRMKKGALIIDLSCDRHGGVETSIPTTIENPVYQVDGITHYVVDHTPSLFYKSTSEAISQEVVRFLDEIVEGDLGDTLKRAVNIHNGKIIDDRINSFQNRK
ncbi:MAG: N(5)-(carboxyethyl)ornithine synthase [Paludibacteraceae bacterium]|nr:N(5)-(carboxyethyl)ornithine synthase [Paludibacteraceae bacterium]